MGCQLLGGGLRGGVADNPSCQLSEIAQACDEYHIDTVSANQIDSVYVDKFNACAVTAFGADWNRGNQPFAEEIHGARHRRWRLLPPDALARRNPQRTCVD